MLILIGYAVLKKPLIGPARSEYYKFHDAKWMYPFITNWEKIDAKKEKYQERKHRIFMRGIKIGAKKGGGSAAGMQIFEQAAKKKDAAEAG